MPGRFQSLMTRAITPTLGNLKVVGGAGGASNAKRPMAGTQPVSFAAPDIPMTFDREDTAFAAQAFNTNVFVMRCVETIATTISGLPFHAGLDPTDPENYDPTAPLAQLLGPATPQAPGGPNPLTSSRMLWDWSIKQYVCYGRWGWETQVDKIPVGRRRTQSSVIALWPLVAEFLFPYPTDGGTAYFNGYRYQTPTRNVEMKNEQVFYAWKPSLQDWRKPESVLNPAKLSIHISTGLDKYMARLLDNNMVATTMVVSPPFDEPAGRRAFRDQFRSRFTGVEHAGATVFAEAERDEEDTSGNPILQIERIAQTAVEAATIQISQQAKIDITMAVGVPMSLIGNASQRTYANADSEYKNFWTLRILPMLSDLQEYVNVGLSPRLGQEVGWFDLSHVAALKPPGIFAPPMIGDVINFGVADAAQVANALGIPAANATSAADVDTVDVDVESSQIGAGGTRAGADPRRLERVTKAQMMSAYTRYRDRPLNTFNVNDPFILQRYIQREHINVRSFRPAEVINGRVEQIRSKRQIDLAKRRAAALVERTEAITAQIRAQAEHARSVGDEADVWREGVADQADGNPMHSAVSFAQGHPGATGEDYDLYQAGYTSPDSRDDPVSFDQGDALTTFDGDTDEWLANNEALLEKFALAAPDD